MNNQRIIPVDKFIENALYDSKKGYYSKKNPFGKTGDFITAPGISPLFSEMIALWIISFWESLNKPKKFNIVELGPGDGTLTKTLTKTFKKFPFFYNSVNLILYEKSKFLRKIQKEKLKDNNIEWSNNIDKIKNVPTIFFGNEFFDALPIKQFEIKSGKIYERFLIFKNNLFSEFVNKRASVKQVRNLKKFNLLKKNGIIEYPEYGLKKLDKIVSHIKRNKGGLLLIDYGFLKHKNISTLQSLINHKRNNIFENIGNADITSLVNFDLLRNYFLMSKLETSNVVSQSFFLKRIGIINRAEILSKSLNFKKKSDLYYRLLRLLDSRYMGELFKVIFSYRSDNKFSLGFK